MRKGKTGPISMPMKYHKRMMILAMIHNPEDVESAFGPRITAEEAIAKMRASKATYFVDGSLDENNPLCMEDSKVSK